jgi:hypothetical protein
LGGNPISRPGLNEIVPAGVPYTITWNPTTTGTISLALLRGPAENIVEIGTIASGIQNSGSFQWTPSTSLQADVTHYGIKLTVDGTSQFQYSTQFGISNAAPAPAPAPSGGSAKPTTTAAAGGTTTAKGTTTTSTAAAASTTSSDPAASSAATDAAQTTLVVATVTASGSGSSSTGTSSSGSRSSSTTSAATAAKSNGAVVARGVEGLAFVMAVGAGVLAL